jgi:hypothetical protein
MGDEANSKRLGEVGYHGLHTGGWKGYGTVHVSTHIWMQGMHKSIPLYMYTIPLRMHIINQRVAQPAVMENEVGPPLFAFSLACEIVNLVAS